MKLNGNTLMVAIGQNPAPALEGIDLLPLGISPGMKLRWVNALHQPYLTLHRSRVLQNQPTNARKDREENNEHFRQHQAAIA